MIDATLFITALAANLTTVAIVWICWRLPHWWWVMKYNLGLTKPIGAIGVGYDPQEMDLIPPTDQQKGSP